MAGLGLHSGVFTFIPEAFVSRDAMCSHTGCALYKGARKRGKEGSKEEALPWFWIALTPFLLIFTKVTLNSAPI